jgi:Spy/CpxP family protein refolding chaperone
MRHVGESRRLWWHAGLALVMIGLWAVAGWAHPVRGEMGWSYGTPLPALLRAAGVTEDQKAEIKAIVAAHRPTLRQLYGQLRTANRTLSDALLAGGDTTPTVQQITRIRGQLLAETVKMRQEMLEVLTPEQQAKVAQLKDQLRSLQEERHKLLRGETPSEQ